MTAWEAAKLPLDHHGNRAAPLTSTSALDKWLADTDEVVSVVNGQETAMLVDTRPAAF
ncbi:MAG: hypothetical protein R3D61_05445 [Defluviimonas denitrificans]